MMPRIRTIKPEFCTSEQVVECSTNARLLFVLLWCFCDDAGRHPSNTRRIKMEVFPGDDFSLEQVRTMVDELIHARLLVEYIHESKAYLQVTGWKHQRIDKPSYKYPPLDSKGIPIPFVEYSATVLQPFVDRSPPEGNGKEGSGVEGSGKDIADSKNAREPRKKFIAPTIEEIKTFGDSIASPVDAEEFENYYGAQGWKLSNGQKMVDWQRAFRRWTRKALNGEDSPKLKTFTQQRIENSVQAMEDFINGT